MPKRIATWNPARGVWETTQGSFCGHWEPFSETWPAWGMTRSGVAYELPTSVPLMADSESSSSPGLLGTPRNSAGMKSPLRPGVTAETNTRSRMEDQLAAMLLPTPRATDGTKGGPNQRGSSGDLMLPSAVQLLPTPQVADGMGGHLTRSGARSTELLLPGVAQSIGALLPTPHPASVRTSRGAMTRDGQWSAPGLEQAIELAQGILPREFKTWEEVPGWHGASTPQQSADGNESSDDQPSPRP